MISLGCAKNLVNSEQMMYLLRKAGHTLTGDVSDADVNIVNTCGFLESARQEAVDQILELAPLRGKIVVAGCLAELVKEEIFTELPEVSAIVGCGSFDRIVKAAEAAYAGEKFSAFDALGASVSETPRVVTGCNGECRPDGGISAKSAYLKISEGCSNHCAYCLIPTIRGAHVSRPVERILEEAQTLARGGVREIILVAQDLTRYGIDLYGAPRLCELLNKLCETEGIRWIRLHYLYPNEFTDELIDVIASRDKIIKYIDMPIQHCSDEILRAMNRRGSKKQLEELIQKLKERIPGIVIRTTVITGFPGETQAHHLEMCDFLARHRLPRVGAFAYSAEDGTPASEFPGQVPEETKLRRQEQIMTLQRDIMDSFNETRIGQTVDVIYEGYDRLAETFYGRSFAESPDVDGKIFFSSKTVPGDFTRVLIESADNGDLFGTAEEDLL